MKKRVGIVSKMVGQSANPSHLAQAGGPGDLIVQFKNVVMEKHHTECHKYAVSKIKVIVVSIKTWVLCPLFSQSRW